jgi:hypothetical protein
MSRSAGFWLTMILTSTVATAAASQVGPPAASRRCVWESARAGVQSFASAVRAARALAVLFDDDARRLRPAASEPLE